MTMNLEQDRIEELRSVGRSVPRADARAKVTGQARFLADMRFPDLVHISLVRSPFARARIGRIDTAPVAHEDGVLAVVTAAEAGHELYGVFVRDQPIFPADEALYLGQPIAAVVGATAESAALAAARLEVDWEPLPAITDLDEALAVGAESVHPDRSVSHSPGSGPAEWMTDLGYSTSNVCHTYLRGHGDVDAGFAESEYIFEDEFKVPFVQHYALEPHVGVARWDGEVLEVWSPTQSPFVVRNDLANLFGLALNQVIVRVPYVGGGFGGKLYSKLEPMVAACALAVPGRAVRLETSASETVFSVQRHSAVIRIKTGVSRDGRLLARDCVSFLNTGAYTDAGTQVAVKAGYRAPGPYQVAHMRSRAAAIYSNMPPAGAFRGFGGPQVAWAHESQMDLIAERLGMDPVELRLKNLLHRGDLFDPTNLPLDSDLPDTLERVASHFSTSPPRRSNRQSRSDGEVDTGVGFAVSLKDGGGQRIATCAEIRLDEDGRATCLVGSTEIGQGTITALAQIVAEELDIGFDRVLVPLADTAAGPFDSGTNSSRTVALVGAAVVEAVGDVRDQLRELFSLHFDVSSNEGIILRDGTVTDGEKLISIGGLISATRQFMGSQLIGRGYFRSSTAPGTTRPVNDFWEPCVAGVEVDVDRETGEVTIARYVSAIDVGKAINPAACEGQDEGAVLMGIGHALLEELKFDRGQVVNPSLVDYRVPSFRELPREMTTILVENGDGPGPYGAKGAAEGGLLPVAPSIANAIARATGGRIRNLPMTPEAVWLSLTEGDA